MLLTVLCVPGEEKGSGGTPDCARQKANCIIKSVCIRSVCVTSVVGGCRGAGLALAPAAVPGLAHATLSVSCCAACSLSLFAVAVLGSKVCR